MTKSHLHPQAIARVLERFERDGGLDDIARSDARGIVTLIDSSASRGKVDASITALLGSAWERGARAVARAETPRETKAAVAALRATAALSDALGVTEPDPVSEPVPAPETAPEREFESAPVFGPESVPAWAVR